MEQHEYKLKSRRIFLLGSLILITLVIYMTVLYDAQIIHHQDYLQRSDQSILRTDTVKASRGIITDRNGKILISNASSYDLTFDASLLKSGEDENHAILRLLNLCDSQGREWNETFPVSMTTPFYYTIDEQSNAHKLYLLNYLQSIKKGKTVFGAYLLEHPELLAPEEEKEQIEETPSLSSQIKRLIKGDEEDSLTPAQATAELFKRFSPSSLTGEMLIEAGIPSATLIEWMAEDMKIPEGFTISEIRKVLGIRYELKTRTLGNNTSYIFTENVDTVFISLVNDGNYSGAKVVNSSIRQYETACAAHILGTVGALQKEDLENPIYDNYPLDAIIGKSGTEAAFETWLHGQDGRRTVSVNSDGRITREYYSRVPQPGSTVELTIDLEFQEKVEDILANTVRTMNRLDGLTKRGAGAAVIKVGTGEILSLASYPTFDLTQYRNPEYYDELTENPSAPLLNRATSGLYPPGSTLKPITSVAAIGTGAVTLNERIRDSGHWVYPGTRTGLWCWHRAGHGYLNLQSAITNSCNYYFAEVGYRAGMDKLNEYYQAFGLGEHTGIETGDAAGNRATNPDGQDQAPWAAFGQSNQLYTPLQLANAIATLVSGGKHCKAHLLKAVKAYDNSQILAEGDTEPVNVVEIAPATLRAIKTGMRNLAHGTLWQYFSSCVVDAGAKTGTAQIGANKKNNGVFVCFAPYDNPEIAVAIVIERAGAGAALASTAVSILNAYFTQDKPEAPIIITGENQFLP